MGVVLFWCRIFNKLAYMIENFYAVLIDSLNFLMVNNK
jgi:hypothetical protein